MRKIVPLFIAAVTALTLSHCNNPVDKKPLKWETEMDIPVNLLGIEMGRELYGSVDAGAGYIPAVPDAPGIPGIPGPADNCVVMEIYSGVLDIRDRMSLVRKIENPQAKNKISISNKTPYGLFFYALLASEENGVTGMSAREAYNLVTGNSAEKLRAGGKMSMLGQNGLAVPKGGSRDTSVTVLDSALCAVFFNAPAIEWRWLVKISADDFNALNTAKTSVIDARFRLSVKGVNSLDSILAAGGLTP